MKTYYQIWRNWITGADEEGYQRRYDILLLITIIIDNFDGSDLFNENVSSKPWIADNESEEQICWGREFQTASAEQKAN